MGKSNSSYKKNLETLIDGNNRFAFELLKKLRGEEKNNLFFSPSNISQTLAMAYAGARGKTAGQIEKALCYDLKDYDLHRAIQSLNKRLQSEMGDEDSHELWVFNAAWVQDGFELTEAYIDVMTGYYEAGLNYWIL